MNKLAKRVLAFMLMVCMLAAMVPAVVSAETADPYVIDFEIDKNADLTWSGNGNTYTFAGTNFPHALKSNGHAGWLDAFTAYYEAGDINFSFPHVEITEEIAGEDETLLNNLGKVYDERSYCSFYKNPNQFGSYKYNATATTYNWTGLKLQAASTGAGGPATGWTNVLLRAPEAGTYNVTLEYSKVGAAASGVKIYMLPYTAAMKTQMETNVAAWYDYVAAIVAAGDAHASYKGSYTGWISANSETVSGQICNLGEMTVGVDVEEYMMVVAVPAGKATHIQNVTFTPVAEQEIPAEGIERNYSIAGTNTGSNVVLNNTGTTLFVEEKYDAGDIDWSYLGTTANDNEILLDKGRIYTQNFYVNRTGDDNDLYAWEAFKLRSPGEGTYDISFDTATGSTSAQKTQVWTSVYMTEYTEGMDPATVIDPANRIGYHRPEKSDATAATVIDEVGEFTFGAANKEYIIVLHFDGDYNGSFLQPNTDYSSADPAIDCFMTMNTYMRGFIIEPQVEAPTFVPKAYIGTTAYATVAAAAAAAKAGDTVKLAVDFLGNIELPAGVSLDLAGHTWTVSNTTTTNAQEFITDSVGTGKLVTNKLDLFGNNNGKLPLVKDGAYTFAEYDLAVTANDYQQSPANEEATRFWFKLSLDDAAAYDLIASGNSGLTIGVELDWGAAEGLAVTFDNGEGAEAFAAEWAAAAKNNSNIWLYVDITGIDALENDLTVKPVLNINGQSSLYTGSLVYEVA